MFYWQYDSTRSFTDGLLDLLQKADEGNKARLRLAYPHLVAAWEDWYLRGDETFRDFGLVPPGGIYGA